MLTLSEGGSPSHPKHPNTEAHHRTKKTGFQSHPQKWFPWSHNIVACSKFYKQPYKIVHSAWRPTLWLTCLFGLNAGTSIDLFGQLWPSKGHSPSKWSHRPVSQRATTEWWKCVGWRKCARELSTIIVTETVGPIGSAISVTWATPTLGTLTKAVETGDIIGDVLQWALLYFNKILPCH